jgi:serine/threonine protein kinase/cytochrome c-type biogenesis protein CcmH/NrfG
MEVAARLLAEGSNLNATAGRTGALAGRRLKQYEFLSLIGRGGMGEVYRAHDHNLGRDVAIKVLPPEFANDRDRVARLRQEARILATLNHPCIGAIYDVQEENGVCGLVLELVEGETLAERIARGPLPAEEALAIARHVADALEDAHKKGVVHRDLKPANIKLTAEGRVKVLDFGLAKIATPWRDSAATVSQRTTSADLPTMMSAADVIVGTPAYMSPEQAKGEHVDHRTDIWALGCVLFEMLAGRLVFRGKNATELMAAVIRDDPDWSKLPRSPSGIRPLLERCLQKEPATRIASISEVRRALEARPDPSSKRFPAWLSPVALILVFVLAGVLGYMGFFQYRSGSADQKLPNFAVLPLRLVPPVTPESESFADGLTEELIVELGGLPDIAVLFAPTMMRYKNHSKTLEEIHKELDAEFLLDGSIQLFGEKLAIRLSLYKRSEGRPIWTQSYERDYDAVVDLQRKVAEDIALQIQLKLRPEDKVRLAQSEKVDKLAYSYFLEGRTLSHTRTARTLVSSEASFLKALERDPEFADAHGGLAELYTFMGFSQVMVAEEAYPMARSEAQEALKRDPQNIYALVALGHVREEYEWDFKRAEADYKRIIAQYPSHPYAYGGYAELLAALGRFDEAAAMNEKARELDPQGMEPAMRDGWLNYLRGRPQASIQGWERAMTLNTDENSMPLDYLGRAYEAMNRSDEAFKSFRSSWTEGGVPQDIIDALQHAYDARGLKGYWEKRLELESKDEEENNRRYTYHRAFLHAKAGNPNEALNWLEMAYAERNSRLIFVNVDPEFQGMRTDPRFQDLLKRVGLR